LDAFHFERECDVMPSSFKALLSQPTVIAAQHVFDNILSRLNPSVVQELKEIESQHLSRAHAAAKPHECFGDDRVLEGHLGCVCTRFANLGGAL
jgi:hypothetical protein